MVHDRIAALLQHDAPHPKVTGEMLRLMPDILSRVTPKGNCYATAEFVALAELLRLHRLQHSIAPFIAPEPLEYYADFLKRVTMVGIAPHAYWPGYSNEECLVMIALMLLGLDGSQAGECFHLLSARPLPGCKNKAREVAVAMAPVMQQAAMSGNW